MRVWTRSSASRLESGSSNRKTLGSRTMARPMATRWRWPPESCRGLRSSSGSICRMRAASAHALRRSRARRGLRQLQAEGHVVVDGHMRIERVGLEHHGDAALLAGAKIVDTLAADAEVRRR